MERLRARTRPRELRAGRLGVRPSPPQAAYDGHDSPAHGDGGSGESEDSFRGHQHGTTSDSPEKIKKRRLTSTRPRSRCAHDPAASARATGRYKKYGSPPIPFARA